MAAAAGALSKVLVGQTVANLSSAAASGGSGNYTYQWYRSTTSAVAIGSSTIISGATALTLADSGLQPNTTYYYAVEVVDTTSSTSATSTDLTVLTEPALSPNQFSQTPYVGVVDMTIGPTNVMAAQIDSSVAVASAPWNIVYPGQAVQLVTNTQGGVPHVAPCSSKSASCIGFVIYSLKDISYAPGTNCEVARWGTVQWLIATAAITQGAEVCLDPTQIGGVQPTGNSATMVGSAIDGAAAAGDLIRVMLNPNPSFATA